jgi:peroxiredoxin
MIRILFVLLITTGVTNLLLSQDVKYPRKGDVAPVFSIKTTDGEEFNTAKLKGKVIYINFFATWCRPCMVEMPHIEREIWNEISDNDFVMIAIAREQTTSQIAKFKEIKNFTMPMAADTDRSIYSLFAEQYIPRNIIINRKGIIIYSEKNYSAEKFDNIKGIIKKELNLKK